MTTTNIEKAMNWSIQVWNGMTVIHPQFGEKSSLNVSGLTEFEHCYSYNNGIVCFVYEGSVYVSPYTKIISSELEHFEEKYFYVPFSNWDYPVEKEYEWNILIQKANKANEEEFKENCVLYCEMHGIHELPKNVISNCFLIPDTGVQVQHPYWETVIYPVISERETFLDDAKKLKLGKYAANNGKVVFVSPDARTYVAKGYGIIADLKSCGYTAGDLWVPFSNGEEIVDWSLKQRWEAIESK